MVARYERELNLTRCCGALLVLQQGSEISILTVSGFGEGVRLRQPLESHGLTVTDLS